MKRTHQNSSSSSVAGRRFAVFTTQWYEAINQSLLEGAVGALLERGALETDIEVFSVPGAFEMPLAARLAANTSRFDGIVCLGAVIRGDTPHFDFIAGEAAAGIAATARETLLPVGFGILTCDTIEQAEERARPGAGNKGAEAAAAVADMIVLKETLSR